MSDGSPGQDFQLSVAALSIATLSWNFAKLVWNPQDVQIEGESCRIRKRYLPFFASYCEKSSSPDHLT